MRQNKLDRPLRVCYFGTYRANYSRNEIMLMGLRRNNIRLDECHEQLWHGIQDRVETASGGWFRPAFILRVIRTYWRLLKKYVHIGDYDVMVLGYPGQLDIYLARLLTWLRRKPLVLDVFMSLYLIASERGLTQKHPMTARVLYLIEKTAYRLPDRLIQDTAEYVQWFHQHFGIAPERFRLVPTGADDRVFQPLQASETSDDLFRILYFGTFIPNHGVENIVEAARILQDEPGIRFELAGEGPTRAQASALAQQYQLTNVALPGWIDKHTLPHLVAGADVCLGVFGTTPQSMMTVQNKIYEALAMRKPLITGESPTVRAALTDGEHLLLCRRQDPQSLAEAIMRLKNDPGLRARLAEQGYQRYLQAFTPAVLGQCFCEHLDTVVNQFGKQN